MFFLRRTQVNSAAKQGKLVLGIDKIFLLRAKQSDLLDFSQFV
jgi:hypothetical protein